MKAKEEPRKAGTLPLVRKWNSSVPSPANSRGGGYGQPGEGGDQHSGAEHGEHMLNAQDQHFGTAQLPGVIDALVWIHSFVLPSQLPMVFCAEKDNQQMIVHTQRGNKGVQAKNNRFSMTGTILCSKSRIIVSDREKAQEENRAFSPFSETAKRGRQPGQTLALVMVDFDGKNG